MTTYQEASRTKFMREKVATQIATLARAHCAHVAIDRSDRRVSITCTIAYRSVGIHLDAESRADCFLANWYCCDRKATYPNGFGEIVRGTQNAFHGAKATTMVNTLDELLEALGAGFAVLRA